MNVNNPLVPDHFKQNKSEFSYILTERLSFVFMDGQVAVTFSHFIVILSGVKELASFNLWFERKILIYRTVLRRALYCKIN